MINLLHAGLTRLRKNKLFWLLMLFSILVALFMIYTQYRNMNQYGTVIEVEQLIMNYGTMTGIVIATFASLFLGSEYGEGTIRNKLCIGHKRMHIYFANLFIVVLCGLCSFAVFTAVVLALGIPLFGGITISMETLLLIILGIALIILAYSAIFTLIAMIVVSKAVAAVACILLAFALFGAALTCLRILDEPQNIQSATITDGAYGIETIPNPKYPSELKKQVCQTLLDMNPAGQAVQISGRAAVDFTILSLYSSGIFIVFTAVGCVLFQHKEIR